MRVVLLFTLLSLSHAVFAAGKGCLPVKRLQPLMRAFTIQLNQKADYCDPKNRHYRVLEALMLLWELAPNNTELPGKMVQSYDFQGVELEEGESLEEEQSEVLRMYNEASPEVRGTFKGAISGATIFSNYSVSIWGDQIILQIEPERGTKRGQSIKVEFKLPSGSPILFRQTGHSKFVEDDYNVYVLNDRDQLFALSFNDEGTKTSVREIENPYPGYTYISKISRMEAREEFRERENKFFLNKRNAGKEFKEKYPEEEPLLYLLDKDGKLWAKDGEYLYRPSEMLGRRFERMSLSSLYHPEIPEELM